MKYTITLLFLFITAQGQIRRHYLALSSAPRVGHVCFYLDGKVWACDIRSDIQAGMKGYQQRRAK